MEHNPWLDSLRPLIGEEDTPISPSPATPKPRKRYGRTWEQYRKDLFLSCYEKYRRVLEEAPPMNSTEIAELLHTNRQNVNITYARVLKPRGVVERLLIKRGRIYTYLWIWKGIQE